MSALANKVALVTGGGGGIGSAVARRLAAEGARIVITYRSDEAKASAVLNALPGAGHSLHHAPVDDSAALASLAQHVQRAYGRLDVLVNNAGITRPVPHADLEGLTDELIDEIFRVNWRGAFACVRALHALLAADEGGVVVNLSSVAGQTGLGSNVAYCASKAALDSMTRSLARALAPRVRVVSVAPGWVAGEYADRMPTALIDEQRARTPLGRIATADDVAQAVLAVITHLTFTTGSIIPVDGGRPLGT
jgi:3-oxoacyl-[acyl-carrier protein] reductase